MIHFELIFVVGMRSVSGLMTLMSVSTICWKDHLCCAVLPLLIYQRPVDYIYVVGTCIFKRLQRRFYEHLLAPFPTPEESVTNKNHNK